jgi:hypothetical protein
MIHHENTPAALFAVMHIVNLGYVADIAIWEVIKTHIG